MWALPLSQICLCNSCSVSLGFNFFTCKMRIIACFPPRLTGLAWKKRCEKKILKVTSIYVALWGCKVLYILSHFNLTRTLWGRNYLLSLFYKQGNWGEATCIYQAPIMCRELWLTLIKWLSQGPIATKYLRQGLNLPHSYSLETIIGHYNSLKTQKHWNSKI